MTERLQTIGKKLRSFFAFFRRKCVDLRDGIRRRPTISLCALAFFIPFLLCACMYFLKGSYPFGEGSVLVLDLNGQYVYFYEEMQDIFRGQSSFIYTWQRALGGEFLGMLAYYVASPFLLLVLLFPSGYILDAIFLIFLCKAGVAGATMAFYLHRRYPNKDTLPILLFSSMYALSAYAVVQMHNSMWIDALIYLPLLIYGMEELIARRRGVLFATMLGLTLLANFYIGYMVCIFCFFYFFYAFFGRDDHNPLCETKHFLRSILRVAIYAAIGIAIAAAIILPAYYSLQFGKTDFTSPSYEIKQNYNFLEILAKLFPGSYDTVRPEGLPFIYCGTLTLILLPFYFISQKVKVREKIAGAAMIGFFFISFNLSVVDLVWHGFQFPNWLNHRYSFLLTFFFVLFAYRAFCEIEAFSYRHMLVVISIETLVLLLVSQTTDRFNDFAFVWASLACIGLFVLVLYALKHESCRRFARGLLCGAVSLELCLIGLLNLGMLDDDVGFTTRTNYMDFQARVTPITNHVLNSDPSFYRMEKTITRMKNDIMQFNMRGLSNSTSTLNAKALTLLNRMGLVATSNWSEYRGGNPLTDSLLGLKYVISDRPLNENFYSLYAKDETAGLYAYYNPYALSVAGAVSPNFKDLVLTDSSKKDYNQNIDNYESACVMLNAMTSAMLGKNPDRPTNYFIPLTHRFTNKGNPYDHVYSDSYSGLFGVFPTENGDCLIQFSFTAPDENPVYLFLPIYEGYRREGSLKITRGNGTEHDCAYKTVYHEQSDCLIELGSFNANERITITIEATQGEMYFASGENYFFSLNTEAVKEALLSLQQTQMQITEHSDTRLFGKISASADRTMLYTSIPYDANWHIYIDGVEIPTYESAEALLAADISAGEHTIELRYIHRQFYLGLGISAGGIAALIGLAFLEKFREKKWQQKRALTAASLPPPEEKA